ncbi:hypothetical protein QTN24_15720 [Cupriavidus sp. SZY C1]|uniref:hypothetical protein n=1 Tax=Cupriavidus sp. SZY C1 TaxID=3055037 RepID=UPI0028B75EBB|nr:hypothetical protein [Cupriavidus sp. SZY C1]MDT6962946.1 hypothetical protein [Cupriavidus sp. SZY C1]
MDRYQAEDEIEYNLRAGAIEEYVDGDTALAVLGNLVKLFHARAKPGIPLVEHLRQVNLAIAGELAKFTEQVIADNVDFVITAAAEDRRNARSDYRERVSEAHH